MGTLEDMRKNPYFFEITDIHFRRKNPPMISPFVPTQVRKNEAGEKIISYGTSSMGYDVRLANKFKIFTNVFNALIDPLAMPENTYIDHEGDFVIIPPHSYVLGHTIEYFTMPEDVVAICVGKSTYARSGCAINVTPIEPGFCGNVVIEIANQTPLPMKVYSNQGIAQFLFLRGDPCETSYGARNGKYQGQTGIQTALV
jgi:dCTP deaminase